MMRSPALVRAGIAGGVRATRRSPGQVSLGPPTDNAPASAIQPPLPASGMRPRRAAAACADPTPTALRSFPLADAGRHPLQHGPGVGDHVVDCESEVGHGDGARCRGTEAVEGHGAPVLAYPALPAEAGK